MDMLLMVELQKKAKTKKDGVYVKKHIMYTVKDGRLRFYSEYLNIYEIAGIFSVNIGRVKEKYELRKELTRISNLKN